ncbi:hypothetical protein ACGF0D_21620 [Kitasatospora sp. NPDC048298]|uniref:hypothetical protein n=1 Tax=Kitasatospora sp. NPDC048298 TaxID=3364049 RepID=UPI003710CF59
MTTSAAFFLAPDDLSAAGVHLGGPQGRFTSMTGRDFYGDDAVDEWGDYFVSLPPDQASWGSIRWIVPMTNDGSGTFAFPPRLTHALAGAGAAELTELAHRWSERLRREDGDDMTDDDLPAIVRAVAQLATIAVAAGGSLYCRVLAP